MGSSTCIQLLGVALRCPVRGDCYYPSRSPDSAYPSWPTSYRWPGVLGHAGAALPSAHGARRSRRHVAYAAAQQPPHVAVIAPQAPRPRPHRKGYTQRRTIRVRRFPPDQVWRGRWPSTRHSPVAALDAITTKYAVRRSAAFPGCWSAIGGNGVPSSPLSSRSARSRSSGSGRAGRAEAPVAGEVLVGARTSSSRLHSQT